jgi:diguanylate cyclase (GGDEF)-like protein/putative nucleotidyltransferase with HDIG domain
MDAPPDTRADWPRLASALADLSAEVDEDAILVRAVRLAELAAPGWTFVLVATEGGAPRRVMCGAAARLDTRAVERWAWEQLDAAPEAASVVREAAETAALAELDVEGCWTCAVGVVAGDAMRAMVAGVSPPADVPDAELLAQLEAIASHAAAALGAARRFADQAALASRDPLTGLLNHRRFHEALGAALEGCRTGAGPDRLAVVLFDLDGFKHVNDAHGHAAGDRVLRAVASGLASACRSSDLAFRIGGDEFALLLPSADGEDAQRVAGRVRDALAELEHPVGPAFGVATWPDDGPTKERILGRADARLYTAKGDRAAAVPAPITGDAAARVRDRLAVASRMAAKLAPLRDEDDIARLAVEELHQTFRYFLAVVQRIGDDGILRVVAAAGPLADDPAFLAQEQRLHEGVNGRVARTGEAALVADSRLDPDYLRRDPRTDPGSELSLPVRVDGRVWGVLNIEEVSTHAFDDDDLLLADTIAWQIGAAVHRAELVAETESALLVTLGSLCDALEAKDHDTATHARDVAELAAAVATRLGLEGRARRHVRDAALLHDIGKIAVPTEILRKAGPLTPAERAEMETHSDVGADLVARIDVLAEVAPLVRASHERWDGDGYPRGLAGEAIPLGARIVCACDAFHAMTTDRPYRAARSEEEAVAELRRSAGSQFDPAVVTALIDELVVRDALSVGTARAVDKVY